MRNGIFFILSAILLAACSAAQQHLNNGNYQAAIEVGAQKMRTSPKKADKTILAIERAFKIEKSRILDRVNQLKLDGNPKKWVEIYNLYRQLNQYQTTLKPILPLFIRKEFRNADIKLINIDQELADTKLKAASFLYEKANQLLQNNSKQAARNAYAKFNDVKTLYSNFKDIDSKIQIAYQKGQNHILVRYTNASHLIIPQAFMNNLKRYNVQQLNSDWTKFYFDKNKIPAFDYFISVNIQHINIGPEQIKESSYENNKRIEDGWQYVLDKEGNVAKDTAGNDIKETKYTNVKALIIKTEQTKVGTLAGEVLYQKANGEKFKQFPFREDLIFQNFFARMQGDQRALSNESRKLLGGRALAFPTDIQMVMDASEIIKNKTFQIIKTNQNLVYN